MKTVVFAALALALALPACKKAKDTGVGQQPVSPATPAAATPGSSASKASPPAKRMALPRKLSASHILFMYKGARRAPASVTRTKEAARQAAEKALADLKGGADFKQLAKERSDCPSKRRGGFLGVFRSFQMVPAFSQATAALKEGELSGVVETPFGFHVIRREKIEEVRASHILYMYKGSMRAPKTVTRSKEAARTAAEHVLAKLKAGGNFAELAAKESDCPSKRRGGDLGAFGKGMMAPAFEKTAFHLKVGELSGVVETPFGFHVIKRTN